MSEDGPDTESDIQKAVDLWNSLTEAEKAKREEQYKLEQSKKWAAIFECPDLAEKDD